LQKLKEMNRDDALYASLDALYFTENKLYDFAEEFFRNGGKFLFLDEVHKYAGWSQELKNIYDFLPGLRVIFTSSSAIELYKGQYDLSRRVISYHLQGLSLREFLHLKYGFRFSILKLDDILAGDKSGIPEITNDFKPYRFLKEYHERGYYPFFMEDEAGYHHRLETVVNTVIESDLPAAQQIEYNSVLKLKKLLYVLSEIVPYTPNISDLARQIGSNRDTVLKYLWLLHKAKLLHWISSDKHSINFLNKPDKLYLENTNIAAALNFKGRTMDKGSLRETFVLNQLTVCHNVTLPKSGDFLVDDKWILEIGGKSKTLKQIAELEDAYIVADDLDYMIGKKIPIWIFGFLY
jgi:uncharacterized protein